MDLFVAAIFIFAGLRTLKKRQLTIHGGILFLSPTYYWKKFEADMMGRSGSHDNFAGQ